MKITSSMFIYLVLLEKKWRSENISNASKVLPLKDTRCGVSLRCCSPKDPPQFSSVQSPSCVQCSVTPWTVAHQVSLSITISWSSLKCSNLSMESVMPSNHLILCRPLLLLPSIFPSIFPYKYTDRYSVAPLLGDRAELKKGRSLAEKG